MATRITLDGDTVREARFAWGSMGPTVVRCPEAEAILQGRPLTLPHLREAADAVRNALSPINDLRASAEYRGQVTGNLLRLAGQR